MKSTRPIPYPLDFSPPNLLRLLKLANAHRLPTSPIPSRIVAFNRRQGRLTTKIERVTRFHLDDAIVVSGTITNRALFRRVKLHPSQFQLQVGNQLYPLSMTQVPEVIAPRKSVHFSAILMGDGKYRADISDKQIFHLIIPTT